MLMAKPYYTETPALKQRQIILPIDRAIFGISLILMIGGFSLYQMNLASDFGLRNLRPVAKVAKVDAGPRRKIPGTLSWIETHQRDVLYDGDQILTQSGESVSVAFDQGGQLLIGPHSLVRIEVLGDRFQVDLVKGSVRYDAQGSAASDILVRDADGNRGIKVLSGEDVRLSREGLLTSTQRERGLLENGLANRLGTPTQGSVIDPTVVRSVDFPFTQVTSGKLVLSNSDGVTVAELPIAEAMSANLRVPTAGQYTARLLDSTGSLVGKTTFSVVSLGAPTLRSFEDRSIFFGERVELSWAAVPEKDYEVLVTSPRGSELHLVKEGRYSFAPQISGDYTVQVTLVDGKRRYASEPRTVRLTVKDGLAFQPGQMLQSVPKGTNARFNITNPTASPDLVFEVSRSESFREILQTIRSQSTDVEIPMAETGIFYVRAQAKGTAPISSQVAKVIVKSSIAKPAKSYAKEQAMAPDKAEATLSWKKTAEVEELRLQVAKDDQFNEMIHDRVTKKESEKVIVPGLGRYFWRLLPIEGAPEFLGPSQPFMLSMESVAPPRIPSIIPQQVLQYENESGSPTYQIQLLPYPDAVTYELEVFSDVKLKNVVFKRKSSRPVVEWTSNRSGRYYYRMRVEDKWGRTSAYSPLGELIFPISPMVEL